MKITTKVYGAQDLIVSLRNTGKRVVESARKTMHRGADAIVSEAQLNTPVDKHNLEQSIQKEISYGDRGRLEIDIVVGGFVNGVNVDTYAIQVHENYQSMNPGPGTLAKRLANPGRYVGEKFLERALEDQRERFEKVMINAVIKEWFV